jgi:hypothetical protein
MHGQNIVSEQTNDQEGFIKVVDADNNLLAVLDHKKGNKNYNYCCVFNR